MQKPILLLVEDAEDDIFLFRRTFGKSGADFDIQEAHDSAEAIEFLQNAMATGSLPRIVFLDLKMPIVNGFEVLAWMQKQNFPRPVPTVVVSGSAQQESKDRASSLGAVGYLVKPVKVPELQNVLGPISATSQSNGGNGSAHPKSQP